jgi:hypothetical protein
MSIAEDSKMTDPVDLLGNSLTDTELTVLAIHDQLKSLLARPDLPPCVASNARFALAATWQMVTDLALRFDQDEDAGI